MQRVFKWEAIEELHHEALVGDLLTRESKRSYTIDAAVLDVAPAVVIGIALVGLLPELYPYLSPEARVGGPLTFLNGGPQAPGRPVLELGDDILEAVAMITYIAISSDVSHFSRRTASVGGTGAVATPFASTPALMTQRYLPGWRYALMPTCHSKKLYLVRMGTWAYPA